MSEYREIRYEVADGIATVTLHRPDRLNAFTATMARELVAAFDATDADDDVRVVLVTGAGRGFCAGADLEGGAGTFDASERTGATAPVGFGTVGEVPRDVGGVVALRIAASRKPVIAAVNGPAVGVGATMTLPADVRIAATSARLGFVFAPAQIRSRCAGAELRVSLDGGSLLVAEPTVFDLERAGEALRALADRAAVGKLVLLLC